LEVKQVTSKEAEDIFHKAIMSIIKGVRVYAWPCFRIPPSNALIPLMNASILFEARKIWDQKRDIDFLIALSLISGRKFIQACEIFRKLQTELLQTNSSSKKSEDSLEKAI
jgi:hydroxylamine reductase (hybrid-cluster protein)